MKNKKIVYIIFSLILVVYIGCNEVERNDFIDQSGDAPPQVTVTGIRNTPGGAVVKYTLPEDKNLLYVQAEYEIRPGVKREAKSSYFKDSLVLEGFGKEKPYEVNIYTVGRNKKASAPITETVYPTTPPVILAGKSLRETFSGVAVDLVNPGEANLAIVLLGDTAKHGYLTELFTFYTGNSKGAFNYRPQTPKLDTIPYTFGVYLRDRWDNYSDTVIVIGLKPWYEEEILKDGARGKWAPLFQSGTASIYEHMPVNASYPLTRMFDGLLGIDGFHGRETHELPSYLTWDLNSIVKLSRLRIFPRQHGDDRWKRGHPYRFELWGSLRFPNSELDHTWIPLGSFISEKPSGPGAQITQEDIDFSNAGLNYDLEVSDFAPFPQSEVRYLRLVTRETYAFAPISTVHIVEIDLWGIYVE